MLRSNTHGTSVHSAGKYDPVQLADCAKMSGPMAEARTVNILPEERRSLPVLGVPVLEPAPELRVVLLALLSSVAESVVAQIQEPAALSGSVRSGSMWRVATEHRDIARRKFQDNTLRQIDRIVGQLVVHAVAWREAALVVIPGKDLRCAVGGIGGVDRHNHREESRRERFPGDVILMKLVARARRQA